MSRSATPFQRFPWSAKLALTLALILSCHCPAGAVLTNGGLEPFDGVNIDLGTWRQVNPELISQNNAVFFAAANSPGYVTELITTEILGQLTRVLPSSPEPLHIALGARSVDATFDNLQLFGTVVPEPSSFCLLMLVGGSISVRRMWIAKR